ncbi:Hypothetical protein FKW44_017438 [Caligus rogercresseyi]|uniref:Uncharacterized protein n=1 Tax=Caligus rogercresseyi TaxID=217165 RepID=A0A7T8GT00_CALRO|nr:Hypothetical protein FKW44_017438 [Caligus rogercresseyi]
MGPHVLPNTIGVIWGYKSPRQWGLGFRQPNRGVLGVNNPQPMDLQGPSNTIRVFWGYKSPAQWALGSAKLNRGVLGL